MAFRQQSLERMALLCRYTILNKIWAGVSYGARAYIYQGSTVADMELNSPQCILLSLLYALVAEDIMSCCLLADVCHQLQKLQSNYLRVWLTGDFEFPRQDMEKAMVLLSNLLDTGVLKLPSHVMRIMSSIVAKYKIHGTGLSPTREGCNGLENGLEEAILNNSPGGINGPSSGDVNGSTLCGNSLIQSPLEKAMENNCVSSLKTLLSSGANVNKRLFRGNTYLHIAATRGHNDALEVLLAEGMEVNKKNHLDETPLFQAVRGGNFRAVEMLLEKEADTGILPEGSKSLLEMAVESQNVEMFKALVKVGMDQKFKDGDTISHLVARFGISEMLELIKEINFPVNVKNQKGLTPLHVASNPSILNTLVRMGLELDDRTGKGETALYLASAKGSLELVRILCQEDAAVDLQDNQGITALMIALKNSQEDIATYLLHNGADPAIKDKEGRYSLHYAAEGGCAGLVIPLLKAGAKVDDQDNNGDTPAFVAAVNVKAAVLQQLVQNGADLNLRDSWGDGIIHREARSGRVEVMKVLLDAGVKVDMRSQWQWTALHLAVREGHTEVLTMLLDAGAALDAKDSNHWTALHHAAAGGRTAVMKALLDRGADPGAISVHGVTPLMEASSYGNLEIVQLLLDRGAPVNARDKSGLTALCFATNNNYSALAAYLRSKGGHR